MYSDTRNARIVGALFLIATVAYILGSGMLKSILNAPDYLVHVYPNASQVIIGVLLEYVDAAAVVGIGVLLFPILKKHSETIALGYVATRILECALLVVGGIGTLSLIALSQETIQAASPMASSALTSALLVAGSHTAYLVAMSTLGLGSLPFCYLLYRSRLIPRSMAVLGLLGYAALLVGTLLELFGIDLHMVHYLPGGLFELILPIWLIVKGFKASTSAAMSGKPPFEARDGASLSRA